MNVTKGFVIFYLYHTYECYANCVSYNLNNETCEM